MTLSPLLMTALTGLALAASPLTTRANEPTDTTEAPAAGTAAEATPPQPPAPRRNGSPLEPADKLDGMRVVLGVVAEHGPIYYGQAERDTRFRPMFALRWGRVRVSSSGAGGLLGDGNAGGASTDFKLSDKLTLRTALRLDRGRRISDDTQERLVDLPRVRSTVRGRITLSQQLSPLSSWSLSSNTDLLGRGGGTLVQLGYSRQLQLPDALSLGGSWTAYAQLTGADDAYMNRYFGIPPGGRVFGPYEAEGGLRDAAVGLGWRRDFGSRKEWVVFGGLGVQRLLGSAADAPFVNRLTTVSGQLGLAWRY